MPTSLKLWMFFGVLSGAIPELTLVPFAEPFLYDERSFYGAGLGACAGVAPLALAS